MLYKTDEGAIATKEGWMSIQTRSCEAGRWHYNLEGKGSFKLSEVIIPKEYAT